MTAMIQLLSILSQKKLKDILRSIPADPEAIQKSHIFFEIHKTVDAFTDPNYSEKKKLIFSLLLETQLVIPATHLNVTSESLEVIFFQRGTAGTEVLQSNLMARKPKWI